MAIKAVIIDDEPAVCAQLEAMLTQHFSGVVKVRGTADDVDSGLKLVRDTSPDLVFLDIKMKRGTGFDLLEQAQGLNFEVVFITAYDEFAVQAFRLSAFGYLLKPIQLSELEQVVDRFASQLDERYGGSKNRLKVLIENYSGEQVRKLVLRSMQGFEVIELRELLRLESDVNYTRLYTKDGNKYTVSRTLKHYEELLLPHGFFRVHQQHVINLGHVLSYHKGEGGTVSLSDGTTVPVSKNRKPGFLSRFL